MGFNRGFPFQTHKILLSSSVTCVSQPQHQLTRALRWLSRPVWLCFCSQMTIQQLFHEWHLYGINIHHIVPSQVPETDVTATCYLTRCCVASSATFLLYCALHSLVWAVRCHGNQRCSISQYSPMNGEQNGVNTAICSRGKTRRAGGCTFTFDWVTHGCKRQKRRKKKPKTNTISSRVIRQQLCFRKIYDSKL